MSFSGEDLAQDKVQSRTASITTAWPCDRRVQVLDCLICKIQQNGPRILVYGIFMGLKSRCILTPFTFYTASQHFFEMGSWYVERKCCTGDCEREGLKSCLNSELHVVADRL